MKQITRYPELGCSVMSQAFQQSFRKTPEAVTEEAMRIMDERDAKRKAVRDELIAEAIAVVVLALIAAVVLWLGGVF